VGVPDDMMGEKGGAIVVPVPGTEFDLAVIVTFAGDRLADFKVPKYVQVRSDPLPRNAGGKVLKSRLRDETKWGSPCR
jgi:long-chain acyl-CoA synthetase